MKNMVQTNNWRNSASSPTMYVPLIFIVMPELNIYAIIQNKQQKDHSLVNF